MRKKLDRAILAHGEVTGHYHEAIGNDVALWDDWMLAAPEGASIEHQEHGTVEVPPGEYDRVIVQRWDHAAEEAKDVVD